MTDFGLVLTQGPAAALHERPIPDPVEPVIWWHDVTVPALVLGSSQDASVLDVAACRAAGIDVVRRRSGGGAVLMIPGEVVWFDVIVPVGLVAEISDLRGSMVWLGRRLLDVLELGGGANVHDGGLVSTAWSTLVCFDGIGPGEILVHRSGGASDDAPDAASGTAPDDASGDVPGDGRGGGPLGGRAKLVGISQRRTRAAARFQVCWHTSYDPAALPALLLPEHRPPLDELRPVATLDASGLGTSTSAGPSALPERLRTHLSAPAPLA